MHFRNIIPLLTFIFLCSCGVEEDQKSTEKGVDLTNEIVEPAYTRLVPQIEDFNWVESGSSSTNMSFLPNFDENNLEHWRAILKYGYDRSNTGLQAGNRRLIFFTNSGKIEKQYSYNDITDHNASIIFAMYQSLPNGNELFSLNPFGTFPEEFYTVIKDNKDFLNENHHNAIE